MLFIVNINLLLIVFFVATSYASFLELNESTLLTFPPLFALDDWARCQDPGDQYCIVDAHLSSNGNHQLMALLEEYSSQQTKHYNRSLVHRGMCLVTSPNATLWDTAQERVNSSLSEYGLQAELTSVSWCTGGHSEQPTTLSSRLLGALLVTVGVLSLLATALHLVENKAPRLCGNKFLRAFSIKQNWQILTYNKFKPRSDKRMKDIACLEGLRFMGLQMVIFSHVFLIYVYSFIDNPEYVEKMYDKFGWQLVLNSPLWLQNLFTFSGFLQMYIILIATEKRPLTLIQCFMGIINRYIRLTPLALFALWFTISWYGGLGGGPQWGWLVQREAEECAERWWYHALYVHNHIPLGKFCMGHTWYLAADMQLHIFGLFLIYLLLKCRCAIAPALAACIVASGATAGLVAYFYDLTPLITGQPPEQLRLLFRDSAILPLLYIPSWMNLAGFAAGMLTAHLLYQDQKRGYKLKDNVAFNVAFHCSILLCNLVLAAGVVFLAVDTPPPRWAAAAYAALDRPALALAFNLLLLGCVARCKSAFRDFLAWRGFHAVGRLSYAAYIVHFMVLRLLVAAGTQLNHASIASMISLQIVVTFLTYLASIPLCLFIELPPIQLWKAITERPQSTTQVEEEKKDVYYINRNREA